jgi:hypothetical protein
MRDADALPAQPSTGQRDALAPLLWERPVRRKPSVKGAAVQIN